MSPGSNPSDSKPEPDPFDDSPDFDSNCSTPYVSAPSSPGRGPLPFPPSSGYFYSAPASPMHFFSISSSVSSSDHHPVGDDLVGGSGNGSFEFEFEFSSRAGSPGHDASGAMISADELFLNGQIRPMKLSTHLERPQALAPLADLANEDDEDGEGDVSRRGREFRTLKNKSLRRRTRSMSPLRNMPFDWNDEDDDGRDGPTKYGGEKEEGEDGSAEKKGEEALSSEAVPSMSASSSRSSSAGRSSKRWVFIKDFLRSKSEGSSNNKFWATISFSPAKDKRPHSNNAGPKEKANGSAAATGDPTERIKRIGGTQKKGGVLKGGSVVNNGKKKYPARSAHELHYAANRAQAEELRRRTFPPYREGLFGCLGFSSKGYGTLNGFARALNPVSSR